jgi:hypothetical protein
MTVLTNRLRPDIPEALDYSFRDLPRYGKVEKDFALRL